MSRYCQIIVDILSADTDRLYTYRVPEGMALDIGCRVKAPFGGRTIEGVVLGFQDETDLDESRIKPIAERLDEEPAILPELMALARDMADSAHCPLAACLRLMLPAQLRGGRVKIKFEKAVKLLIPADGLEKARAAQGRSAKRRLLIDLLSDGREHWVSDLKVLVRDPLMPLGDLEKQGIVTVFDKEVRRSPYADIPLEEDPVLTAGQNEVLSEILPALQKRRGAFLLHGITGSGKTEVYIRAVRECLKKGLSAIVLVPEIVLTPQIVSWFRGRFGDVAAVLHSRLSAGEKYDEWRRIRLGEARVVIGARSAIFAPVTNLGLVIVDEEHEQSYFSEHQPAYDAREVAQMRAGREGAVVLLASATPSVLSFARAEKGDYMLLEMPERVNGRPLPNVTVVDMREELRLGNKDMFSFTLQEALKKCMAEGGQAMLFVNRRGYAPSVVCRKCGHTLKCGQCDVAYTYHQADRRLHCHYCGAQEAMPDKCPECGSTYLKTCGVGTQRVEEEVKKLLPGIDVVRMDVDTTSGKEGHRKLLNRFRSGAARVMVGTQMIAKGLDFPQVTLVGAVLADLSLNLPDYRSQERTFQLLTQVAGRAGRADRPGEVIIQTYKPEHYAIAAAARQDYRSFFSQEFAYRRRDLYPPFTMMVRLLCQNRQEDMVRTTSGQLFARIRLKLEQHPTWKKRVLFYREDEAPIKRIMGLYRSQVLLKMLRHRDTEPILAFLTELSRENWPGEVHLEIDPASLA